MFLNESDNVNDAYAQGLALMREYGVPSVSRNGTVLRLPRPLTTSYQFPHERVLFDPLRDANPFMHLFEAIWMLSGSNLVAFPGQFAKQLFEYSDDGVTLHGAYGHRWRQHFGKDQIDQAIFDLYDNPSTRRVVIGMWDPYIDGSVAQAGGKDVPCNTHIYFSTQLDAGGTVCLDMTVCCRSNDMVWGAYGANAVHMSILQEYVALSVGIPIGTYYQVSNDFHVYEKHFPLLADTPPTIASDNPYAQHEYEPTPLFDALRGPIAKKLFDLDVIDFVKDPDGQIVYRTEFFKDTVGPMYRAWKLHKAKMYASALEVASQIEATDWRAASEEWIRRRAAKALS